MSVFFAQNRVLRTAWPVAALAALLLAGSAAPTFASPLGAAAGYNVFVFDDMGRAGDRYSSDAEGRVAVGGDAWLEGFDIGLKTTDAQRAANPYSFVVGGDWNQRWGGTVRKGDVHVGGSATYRNNSGTVTIADGSVTTGGAGPIDFAAEASRLTALADRLSALDDTGSLIRHVPNWGRGEGECRPSSPWHCRNELVGTGSADVEIFSIDLADLYTANVLKISNIRDDATVIVNVRGSSAGSWIGGSEGYIAGTGNAHNVLYNFVDATEIKIDYRQVNGSILAARAQAELTYGQVNGSLIAWSLMGSGQINATGQFAGWLPPAQNFGGLIGGGTGEGDAVPVPAMTLLFAGGLIAAIRMRRG